MGGVPYLASSKEKGVPKKQQVDIDLELNVSDLGSVGCADKIEEVGHLHEIIHATIHEKTSAQCALVGRGQVRFC